MLEKNIILFLLIFLLNIFFYFFNNSFAKIFNIYDSSDNKRKIHKKKVPITGGIFIYLNILLLFIFRDNILIYFSKTVFLSSGNVLIFFIILTSIFLVGLIDDKFSISANLKLALISILIFLILYNHKEYLIHFLKFESLDLELNIYSFRYLFTILCFLCFINAVNMFDGINAQAGLYFIFLSVYLIIISGPNLLLFFIIFLLIIFLSQNIRNKSFLGDGGVFLLSMIFACLIIENYKLKTLFVDQIFLMMLIPGIDMIRLVFQRIKNKKHPFEADSLHIHHFLLRKYSYLSCVLISFMLIVIPNFLALYFNNYIFFILFTLISYFYLLNHINVFKK